MPQPRQPVNTIGVIVGLDLVGDALIKLPFVRALRHAFPEAEINWITAKGPTAFGGVLREPTKGLIDHIHECPAWLPTSDRSGPLAATPFFDLLIDTRNRWKLALEARKIPHRVFIAMAMRYLFSDRRPSLFKKRPRHLCDRLLQMVELAAGYMPSSTGALPVPEDLLQKAKQILPEGKTYIGLAPGCSTPVRMWPRSEFVKVALAQSAKGRVPVFILGPQELAWHKELAAAVPGAKFPLQEYEAWGVTQPTLDHTLAVGTRLDLAVGNDSGPGHILAAVNCPIISLFGPTTPLKAAPRTSRGVSLRAQDFGPPFGTAQMAAIPCDAVNAAIDEMLKNC